MQLGVCQDTKEISRLDVVDCGAAKGDPFTSEDRRTKLMTKAIIQGKSLTLHVRGVDDECRRAATDQ